MTYTIKFVNFTLGARFKKSRPLTEVGGSVLALPALYGRLVAASNATLH